MSPAQAFDFATLPQPVIEALTSATPVLAFRHELCSLCLGCDQKALDFCNSRSYILT